ncbi:hypothetical protein [Winogradskyella psychrotolerans]|uniref:hypothetical protein n=1 Tax=Winogradskyella psychrotolerans TaxID=1344585 RepID=UPI001C06CF87|nr:hypothetical protein [Winogradskyella psychrotolerans]MBU2926915.1 hypothetical protein [Winogradskyella psychrotolerans]
MEDEEPPEFDWDHMTTEEIEAATDTLLDYCERDTLDFMRFQKLIPHYASVFIQSFYKQDRNNVEILSKEDSNAILNYLEYGFEIDLDNLQNFKNNLSIVEFSTGNYPFGGLERFIMALRAFDLIPLECFDGFSASRLNWTSAFEYNSTPLPDKKQGVFRR